MSVAEQDIVCLIRTLYRQVARQNPWVHFGVSPGGRPLAVGGTLCNPGRTSAMCLAIGTTRGIQMTRHTTSHPDVPMP
jgi:hypothetical protein